MQALKAVLHAVEAVMNLPPAGTACAADIELLKAALALSEDSSATAVLQAALDKVQQCGFVPPQLLLLASSHDAKWGAHVTRQLEADGEMQPHLQHAKKAFQQGVARQAQQVKERLLRQSLASLPSMEDVQLRKELGGPAVRGGGGAPAAKPPPRSRVLRNLVGNVLWPLFHNILAAAGEYWAVWVGWGGVM